MVTEAVALLEQEHRLAVQVALCEDLPRGEGVVRGAGEDEGVAEELQLGRAAQVHVEGEQEQVELARVEPLDDAVGLVLVEQEDQLRVGLPHGLHHGREQVRRDGGDHAEAQAPGEGFALRARRVQELVRGGEDRARLGGQLEARAGRHHPARVPLEQLHAQQGLQLLELGAERRLGDAARLGRLAEVQVLGDGDEVLELADGGSFHGDRVGAHWPSRSPRGGWTSERAPSRSLSLRAEYPWSWNQRTTPSASRSRTRAFRGRSVPVKRPMVSAASP